MARFVGYGLVSFGVCVWLIIYNMYVCIMYVGQVVIDYEHWGTVGGGGGDGPSPPRSIFLGHFLKDFT